MIKERWAISGSHGFIGSHLVDKIIRDKEKDLALIGRYASFMRDTKVFIDCASFGNLPSQFDISETYNANTLRAINLILQNHTVDYKAFVAISTSSVGLPVQTYYSLSKKATEAFAQQYARDFDKPVVVVRPYSITGVGEQSEHLIPKLIDSCINGTRMKFVPDPVHDFLDIDDFVSGIFKVVDYAKDSPGAIFPIGSGKQYSNQEVLDIVERVTGKKANVEVVDNMRKYDTTEWVADLTMMSAIGWEPEKTLEQSITEMYEQRKNT